MSNNELYQSGGSRDKYTKSVMYDLRRQMHLRIEQLRKEQAELTQRIEANFNMDDYRRLQIVNQHIEVAKSRLRGEWLRGNHPECVTVIKSKT